MNELEKFGDTEPKQLPDLGARMRDVAILAGVSLATVSNAINHPHLVAARTRERVQAVVRELGFQPNPHAKALRGLGSRISEPRQDTVPAGIPDSQQDPVVKLVNDVAQTASATASSGLDPEILIPGKHLSFRVGPEFLGGIVETVMPDGSCFWIWADGGMGRRMIDARDAAVVGETSE